MFPRSVLWQQGSSFLEYDRKSMCITMWETLVKGKVNSVMPPPAHPTEWEFTRILIGGG